MAGLSFTMPAAAAELLYVQDRVSTLPSTDTDWDYMKLEPHGGRLFMARRKDGLVVYDVNAGRQIGVVANSIGANGPVLLPQFDRGYVAMTDGSLLSFELKSLKVIDRMKLADDGGLNGVTFDPATGRIQVLVGARAAQSTWFTLDAKTGALLGKKTFPFKKMDDPAADGRGRLFAPARYDNIIMTLDSKTLEEKARWTVAPCVQPTAVEYQAKTDRLLVACRGDAPVFVALDAASGKVLASVPIGKGVDGLAIDEARGRILTSGADGNLTVIRQDGADGYSLLGNIATRPQAKIMQLDEKSGRVFLITANHTVQAPADAKAAPALSYHPDSFVVMTYRPLP